MPGCMSDPTAGRALDRGRWPSSVIVMAGGFFLVCLAIQVWRLETLSASYDQALFLQELWSTAQGRPFESSLSSVLSAAVALGEELPRTNYLHLGQHANVLTLFGSPFVGLIGKWALPIIQVSALTVAGLVLWRLANTRLPHALAQRITAAYFLSGAVLGPALENFHDLIWLPLLGFLVVGALLESCIWQVILYGALLLLVREDSGLLLFSLGLWALVRQPGARRIGAGLMLIAFVWVLLVTGWIQPMVDSSLSDRFLQEKFGHLVNDPSGGTVSVLFAMLGRPLALLEAIVSPPGGTLGFLLALSLPLLFVPVFSVDAVLLMAAPLLIALLSQGRSALSVTLRYVLALVPGLYLGAVFWWQQHPKGWSRLWIRRTWTAAISLGLVLTILANPHRSLSALIPDSFSPWIHVPPSQMLERRHAALTAVALVPNNVSVSADTPLLPLLAEREKLIRFPNHVQYHDRTGKTHFVDLVVAFPGYYKQLAPVFKLERERQRSIRTKLSELIESGSYRLVYCQRGVVVLQHQEPGIETIQNPNIGKPNSCPSLG